METSSAVLCPLPPMLPVRVAFTWLPVFSETLPPSLWNTGKANARTPSQVRTRSFTCTHRPLAKASAPWPSRLRGNQFIGIPGWGARTKGALFEFM